MNWTYTGIGEERTEMDHDTEKKKLKEEIRKNMPIIEANAKKIEIALRKKTALNTIKNAKT